MDFTTADPVIPEVDRKFLEKASGILVGQIVRKTDEGKSSKLPYVYNLDESDDKGRSSKQAKIIYKRWMIALAPWEMHAAFSNDPKQCQAIRNARLQLVQNIHALKTFNEGGIFKTAAALGEFKYLLWPILSNAPPL